MFYFIREASCMKVMNVKVSNVERQLLNPSRPKDVRGDIFHFSPLTSFGRDGFHN